MHKTQQRGFTLIEALVALLVATVGVLGILGVQMRTLADTQTSVRRAQAIRLIDDLGERMLVNPNAVASLADYTSGFDDEPVSSDLNACKGSSNACSRSDLAKRDLAVWKQAVKDNLPLGKAQVFEASGEVDNSNRRLLGVVIAWRENERHDADTVFKESIDAAAADDPDGGLDAIGAGTNYCEDGEGYTCHLQYIPVAARCAPYFSGSSSTAKYYCPQPS